MPKAKPVSLHPLSFDEAIKVLIGINNRLGRKKRKSKSTSQAKKRKIAI